MEEPRYTTSVLVRKRNGFLGKRSDQLGARDETGASPPREVAKRGVSIRARLWLDVLSLDEMLLDIR